MIKKAGEGDYSSSRIDYEWKKRCVENTCINESFECADADDCTYCKSKNDDDNADKCTKYETWDLGRCLECSKTPDSYTNI